ncbi:unnamed protein product [Prorocentrum cordatum]|uniref:Uncharacterized protein n=1 Tax=Prorocentrum cordatum TaxID=2364126 RepID=A0ABN9SWX1_9DINO|nr:unnamed protein product [Polarella glacialis]
MGFPEYGSNAYNKKIIRNRGYKEKAKQEKYSKKPVVKFLVDTHLKFTQTKLDAKTRKCNKLMRDLQTANSTIKQMEAAGKKKDKRITELEEKNTEYEEWGYLLKNECQETKKERNKLERQKQNIESEHINFVDKHGRLMATFADRVSPKFLKTICKWEQKPPKRLPWCAVGMC